MKVIFINRSEHAGTSPWTQYAFSEDVLNARGYVDIRSIVLLKTPEWIADLEASHRELCEQISARCRWWWLTPFSRLDLRPWGMQDKFKPLFFARAILEWHRLNPTEYLYVVNAPVALAQALRDFDKDINLEGDLRLQGFSNIFLTWLKEKLIFKYKWFQAIWALCFRRTSKILDVSGFEKIVLCERFDPMMTDEKTRAYYYGDLFQRLDQTTLKTVVLDQLPLKNIIFVIGESLRLDLIMLVQT